jgi:hypothetical protein
LDATVCTYVNATLTLYINQDAMAMDLAHGHGSPANCHHNCHTDSMKYAKFKNYADSEAQRAIKHFNVQGLQEFRKSRKTENSN